MRYNAFYGELPINAFKPRPGGGMTLHGGGDPTGLGGLVEDLGGAAEDLVGGAVDFVTEHPLESALLAAGVYYAPEIGAYLSSDGAVLGTTEVEAAANAGVDLGGAAATGAGADAAFVAADASQLAAQGLSKAAIEQNLTAAGVDSFIAADAAQLALQGIGQDQMTGLLTQSAGGTPIFAPAVSGADAAGAGAGAGAGAIAAGGITAANVINALPLVPIVNQIVGDPLDLNPTPEPSASAKTGYDIVPIPTNWSSPVYQTSQAPIDLNSIFSTNDLLQGTQWKNLKNQSNMSFNDIFSSGQQSTPMGTPVNINNIVSAILGQATTR